MTTRIWMEMRALAATPRALTAATRSIAQATVGVVDLSPDLDTALALGKALHRQRPGLPLLAVLCCSHACNAEVVATLLTAGIRD